MQQPNIDSLFSGPYSFLDQSSQGLHLNIPLVIADLPDPEQHGTTDRSTGLYRDFKENPIPENERRLGSGFELHEYIDPERDTRSPILARPFVGLLDERKVGVAPAGDGYRAHDLGHIKTYRALFSRSSYARLVSDAARAVVESDDDGKYKELTRVFDYITDYYEVFLTGADFTNTRARRGPVIWRHEQALHLKRLLTTLATLGEPIAQRRALESRRNGFHGMEESTLGIALSDLWISTSILDQEAYEREQFRAQSFAYTLYGDIALGKPSFESEMMRAPEAYSKILLQAKPYDSKKLGETLINGTYLE